MEPSINIDQEPLELDATLAALQAMIAMPPKAPLTLRDGRSVSSSDLYSASQAAGHAYRRGCGMASRKKLNPETRRRVRGLLFRARFVLDSRIEATVLQLLGSGAISYKRLFSRKVFGFCKKQGVSFRLSLSTCVPSRLCGGSCYAHDGRERVTSTILSGCYNTVIARLWEEGELDADLLQAHINKAVDLARADARFAKEEYGVSRRARIRLAHVGELAAYPKFANWLGEQIREISDGDVDGVLYTRHPLIKELDPSLLVVNLTVDESSEERRAWAREGVRVVWSAWDGKLDPSAEVNFLEHHDNGQHSEPIGEGPICPVTDSSSELRFCDAFGCTRCFDAPSADGMGDDSDFLMGQLEGNVRTRKVSMLGRPSVESERDES